MSSNDVTIEKQAARHRGPLIGIAVAVSFAAIILVYMLSVVMDGEVETQIETGTLAPASTTQ